MERIVTAVRAWWARERQPPPPEGVPIKYTAIQSVFKNVFQIDPVRQKWSYRLTIGSLPITAGLFALASHLNQEVERHEVIRARIDERARLEREREQLERIREERPEVAAHLRAVDNGRAISPLVDLERQARRKKKAPVDE